jgi:hypothetical protein
MCLCPFHAGLPTCARGIAHRSAGAAADSLSPWSQLWTAQSLVSVVPIIPFLRPLSVADFISKIGPGNRLSVERCRPWRAVGRSSGRRRWPWRIWERERVRAGHRSGTVRSQTNALDLNIDYRFGLLFEPWINDRATKRVWWDRVPWDVDLGSGEKNGCGLLAGLDLIWSVHFGSGGQNLALPLHGCASWYEPLQFVDFNPQSSLGNCYKLAPAVLYFSAPGLVNRKSEKLI